MSGSRSTGFSVHLSAVDNASKHIDAINRRIAALKAPAENVQKSFAKLSDTTGINALSKGMASVASSSFEAFRNMGRMLGPLEVLIGGASIAGIAKMTQAFGSAGQQLQFTATRANIGANALSKWESVARLSGSSAEAMDGAMVSLSDNITKAGQGFAPEFRARMSQMHIDIRNTNGELKTAAELFPEVQRGLNEIRNPAIQSATANDVLGGSAAGLFPLLQKNAAQMAELQKRAANFGSIMSDDDVKRATDLAAAQRDLTEAIGGTQKTISSALAPALTQIETGMTNWLTANQKLITQTASGWMGDYVTGLGGVGRGIDAVVSSTVGWNRALEFGVPLLVAQMLSPIRKLEAAIASFALIKLPSWLIANPAVDIAAGVGAAAYGAFQGARMTGEDDAQHAARGEVALGYNEFGQPLGYRQATPGELGGNAPWGRGGGPNVQPDPTADRSMSPEMRSLLETIAYGESAGSGNYNAKNPSSSAYGKYQIIDSTNRRASAATGHFGMDPVSQDIKGRWLAEQAYSKWTFGRNLEADIKVGGHEQQIGTALNHEWPSLPGGSQQNTTMPAFVRHLHDQLAANAAQAQQTAPPSMLRIPQAPAVNVAGGSGAPPAPAQPATQTVKGSAKLTIDLNGFPASTRTTSTTDGDLFSGAPRIQQFMGF